MAIRITPRPDFVPHKPMRITPNPGYKPPNLHTKAQYPYAVKNRIEAEWCPICHGEDIGEKARDGRVMWLCKTCNYEW